eukprot:GILI01015990.1.p1 GENE.GILI01015990.1~~GILI01015990.1.p1  ORF type:complete len:302 (-),score=57.89 GILI01015990.1:150-1055(-)
MSIKVSLGPQPEEKDDGVDCKCTKDTWPIVILMTGFAVAFLVCLVSVLSLLTFEGVPQVVLCIYLIILALLGLEAEFRRIKFLRSMIYTVAIKYFYFLTNYYVRGVYYIFMGTMLLGDAPLNIICGGVCIALGCVLMGVHFFVGLPNYTDWQEVKAEAEARVRREAENAAQIASNLRTGNTPGAYENQNVATATKPLPPQPTNPSYEAASVPPPGRNTYETSLPIEEQREPEVPSARRMKTDDDDLAQQYYAQQQQQQSFSPKENASPKQQVYGNQSAPASRRNLADNPFDAADEYQPPRF